MDTSRFSNFKRWGYGTFHGLRAKHIDIYANEFVFRSNRRRHFQTNIDTMLGLGQKIGCVTWRDIVGNTRKWKHDHRDQVLAMVDPERLERAEEYAVKNGLGIFDALDDIRREEHKHQYWRRKLKRPALPPRRLGEEQVTRRRHYLPTHRFLSKQAHISAFPLARTKLPVDGGTQFAA